MSQHVLFNKTIKDIFTTFKELPSQQFKSKLHISELQSKMVRGMQTEEMYALHTLGPLLWRAREEIASKDDAFFLRRRYDIEVAALCKTHKINYDNAINCINFMKDAYRSADQATKTKLMNYLIVLLSTYADFMQTRKS
jgi:hypothetical protein